MRLRTKSRPRSCLNEFIDIKNMGMKHYLIKIADRNNNLNAKSCPDSNFFLFLATSLMCLRTESRPESCLNGFMDMKTMGMKFFKQK